MWTGHRGPPCSRELGMSGRPSRRRQRLLPGLTLRSMPKLRFPPSTSCLTRKSPTCVGSCPVAGTFVLLGLRPPPVPGTNGLPGSTGIGGVAHGAPGPASELYAHDIPAGVSGTCCRCADAVFACPALDGVNPGTGLARCFGCGGLFHHTDVPEADSPADGTPCCYLPCRGSRDRGRWV